MSPEAEPYWEDSRFEVRLLRLITCHSQADRPSVT